MEMTQLTLVSMQGRPLRPLVEAALTNELRLLEAGIRRTEQRLREFEREHGMTTAEFVSRYENDELPETLEFGEWMGEHRMLARFRDKVETLQGIRFES
jgi:phage shock protein A